MLVPPTGTTETTGYGHCPLLIHPAAAVALTAGDATAVATVVAGAAAVAVLPRLIAVGLNDIAGIDGGV
jgi:hypothetical protein